MNERRTVRGLAASFVGCLLGACLVQRAPPDGPAPEAAHEVRRSYHPDQTLRSELSVLVWSDGRVERDGPEREYSPAGVLLAERFFDRDSPTGTWRTWFADGAPRSEVDFGPPGSSAARTNRFWHANGRLAAEGPAVAGVREGRWSYWSESGLLLREGSYRAGRRDGSWSFFDERGVLRSTGAYALGRRVGPWTLWDEQGEPHVRDAAEVGADEEPPDQVP